MTAPIVAVTGGTGFLGRYCVAALLEAGWHVRLLTRGALIHPMLTGPHIDVVPGSLEDEASLARLLQGAEAVLHIAGVVKALSTETFDEVNHQGTARLASLFARTNPDGRFVLISSMAAREPALSAYAASKHAGERALVATLENWVILRPGVVYGPWDHEGIAMLRLASRRLAPVPTPEPRIAMIHARDAAAAMTLFCRHGNAGARYELADACPEGYSWGTIIEAAAQGTAPRLVRVPDQVILAAGAARDAWSRLARRPVVFGRGKAREILHREWGSSAALQPPADLWQPRINLPEGMAETLAWWNAGQAHAAAAAPAPAIRQAG